MSLLYWYYKNTVFRFVWYRLVFIQLIFKFIYLDMWAIKCRPNVLWFCCKNVQKCRITSSTLIKWLKLYIFYILGYFSSVFWSYYTVYGRNMQKRHKFGCLCVKYEDYITTSIFINSREQGLQIYFAYGERKYDSKFSSERIGSFRKMCQKWGLHPPT